MEKEIQNIKNRRFARKRSKEKILEIWTVRDKDKYERE